MTRTVVCVPTYNEIQSLPGLLDRLRAAQPDVDVLVVDDGSPDGTAELALKLADDLGGIDVLERAGKDGLGSAYRTGFEWGFERGFDVDSVHGQEPRGAIGEDSAFGRVFALVGRNDDADGV